MTADERRQLRFQWRDLRANPLMRRPKRWLGRSTVRWKTSAASSASTQASANGHADRPSACSSEGYIGTTCRALTQGVRYLPMSGPSASSETDDTRTRFHILSLVGDKRNVRPLARQYRWGDWPNWVQLQSAPDSNRSSRATRSCSLCAPPVGQFSVGVNTLGQHAQGIDQEFRDVAAPGPIEAARESPDLVPDGRR